MLVYASDAERDAGFEGQLRHDGHCIVGIFSQDDELAHQIPVCAPNILVVRSEHPGSDLFERLVEIDEHERCPMILYSATDEAGIIRTAVKAGFNAIAAGTAYNTAFHTLADVALARFNETSVLRHERDAALTKLAERKLIERAKGIMMKERNLSEEEAYRLLRKMAMDRSEPLKDLATRVIEASSLLK